MIKWWCKLKLMLATERGEKVNIFLSHDSLELKKRRSDRAESNTARFRCRFSTFWKNCQRFMLSDGQPDSTLSFTTQPFNSPPLGRPSHRTPRIRIAPFLSTLTRRRKIHIDPQRNLLTMASSSQSPLPRQPSYISSTRTSCHNLSASLGLTPNLSSIDAFLTSLSPTTFNHLRTQHGLNFPLRFPTPLAEVNFLSILSLLNAYSGYRTTFHTKTGIGAYQNIVRLMIGLYIGSEEDKMVGAKSMTAKGMAEMGEAKVVELLGVSVHEERPHETLPGVTVGVRGGEMLDVVQLIHSTIVSVGKGLLSRGKSSLGTYLVELLQEAKKKALSDGEAADFLTKSIAEDIPEFRDTHTVNGKEVYLFKRIFFLLHSLHLKFPNREDWALPNTYKILPMFVDNVLPTLCVWFNFFQIPTSSDPQMETLMNWVRTAHCNADLTREKLASMEKNHPGPKLTKDETYAIRAATLNVGQVVVERAKLLAKEREELKWLEELNEVDLDGYLWAVAKDDEELRKVPRLVFPSIHF